MIKRKKNAKKTNCSIHSMATANQKKSEEFVTNTTAASNYLFYEVNFQKKNFKNFRIALKFFFLLNNTLKTEQKLFLGKKRFCS